MLEISSFRNKIGFAISDIENIISYFQEKKLTTRSGGYLTIADAKSGDPLFCTLIGSVPNEEADIYFYFSSKEKIYCIQGINKFTSSFQKRNPSKNVWAGSIKIGRFIFSFSGLSEAQDEICSIVAALNLNCELPEEFFTVSKRIVDPASNEDVIAIIKNMKGDVSGTAANLYGYFEKEEKKYLLEKELRANNDNKK